jgi:monoamine oxidase
MERGERRRLILQAPALALPVMLSCAQPVRRAAHADVIVMGAGLAGLNAALILEKAGLSTVVLEASQRIGGRVYTLDNVAGRPDAGANQIGAAYTRIVDMANRLGLRLVTSGRSPLLADDALVYFVDGRRMTRTQWATSPENPFAESLRGMPPERILGRLIGNSPLASITAWRDPANFVHDVSVVSALRNSGKEKSLSALPALSDKALRLLEVNNAYGDTLAETSLLNLFYVQTNIAEIVKVRGPIQNIEGGNQRLPEAMANALQGGVKLGKTVVAVGADEKGVELRCADNSRHRARFAI